MSDNLQLYGFRYHSMLQGDNPPQFIRFPVASGYQANPGAAGNVDLNKGDPIISQSDGSVALATAGTSNNILGIISGFGPVNFGGAGATQYAFNDRLPGGTTWSGSYDTAMWCTVIPVAGAIFEVDCDDNTTFTTEANYRGVVFENCNMSFTVNTTLKKAFPMLSISSHVTTNTRQWRVVGVSNRVNLDYTGKYVKLLVTCNLPDQAPYNTTGT